MPKLRFNIGNLLVIIFVLGVGFAALRESSDLWESGVFTLTIGALLVSILLAVHRTESRHAFWTGFALFGWVYFGLSLVPSIEHRLITAKALAYLDSKAADRMIVQGIFGWNSLSSNPTPINVSDNSATIGFSPKGSVESGSDKFVLGNLILTSTSAGTTSGNTENFVRIGHSLFALLAAWLGGQLSRRLFRSSRSQEPTMTGEAEGTAP